MLGEMKIRTELLAAVLVMMLAPAVPAQSEKQGTDAVLDGTDLNRELQERQAKINQLSGEEQEALRLALAKAVRDPSVREARRKRDEALREFEMVLIRSMLAVDPTLRPTIEKSMQWTEGARAP